MHNACDEESSQINRGPNFESFYAYLHEEG